MSMIMLSKFSNFSDELSGNDELREYELNRSDCTILPEHGRQSFLEFPLQLGQTACVLA